MMRDDTARSLGIATLVLLLGLGGAASCGGNGEPDEQEAVDREMDMALEDREAEPELRDVPQETPAAAPVAPRQTERPRTQAPAVREEPVRAPPPAAPPVPAEVVYAAPAGTTFRVEVTEELHTGRNKVGDRFEVRLLEPIVSERAVVAASGTTIRGRITALQRPGDGQPGVIKVDFDDILVEGRYFPIDATVTETDLRTQSRQGTGERAAKIGGGAAAGAILGRVIGGDAKGTIIGAAVGAAAGTAIMLATDGRDAVLPEGSWMTLQLEAPLEVRLPR